MKKLFTLFLLTLLTAVSRADTLVDGIYYRVLSEENKTVAVTSNPTKTQNSGTVYHRYEGVIKIPSTVTINGSNYTVKEIAAYAFTNSVITEITIPASVESVHYTAFPSPTTSEAEENLTLKKVILEDGDKVIKLGDGIEGGSSFSQQPVTDWYIGRNIENNNAGLSAEFKHAVNITVGDKVTKLYDIQFQYIESLKTVVLGKGITVIPEYSFYNCTSLESVNIPENVTEIGDCAFSGCPKLSSLTIPANVKTIKDGAFATGGHFTDVVFEDSDEPLSLDGAILYGIVDNLYVGRNIQSSDLEQSFYPSFATNTLIEKVVVGDNIKVIPPYLFDNNGYDTGVKSVVIGKSVESIGEYAFGCNTGEGITELDIPANVKEIGKWAFWGHSSLKKLTLHEGLKKIGEDAFNGLSAVESLTIPASVEEIGDAAFSGWNGLTSLTILDSETPLKLGNNKGGGYNGWLDSDHVEDLYLGRDLDVEYSQVFPYVKTLEFGDNFTTICDMMFQGSKIETLKLGKGITTIGEHAFSRCSNLKGTIEIPSKVKEIKPYTFFLCYGVTGVVLPEGLTTIGELAFCGCSSETLIIPASVTTIGSYAFGEYAFGGEDEPDVKLGVVKFVDGKEPIDVGEKILGKGVIDLLYIGRQARYGETNGWQTSAEIKMLEVGQLEELPENTFAEADIASISLGTTLKKIGRNSFTCCKKLKTLSIPSNVQEIGDDSFTDSELVTIEAESTTPCKLGYNVFGRGGSSNYDNYSKAIVYVPSKAIDTYKATDVWKEFKNIQAGWYLVSVTPNTGGTATLEGKTAKDGETAESYIKKGKDTSISLTFNEGYELGSLTVNGVEKKSEVNDGLLAISDIQEDKEVVVNFSKIVFMVTATAGEGGTVTAASKAEWGSDAKVTITPNEGYELKTITVNGKDMTDKVSKGVLTISQVKENLQVEATFKKLTFKITTNSGQGGSISVSSDIVEWGDDATITVTPDKNYEIVSVTVDGTAVTLNEDNAYIISSIKKNITVEATFESLGVVITIGNAKQGTYCSDYDINFRDVPGIKAYVASGYNTATGLIMLTRIYDVPAGMGIMLMAEEPGNYTIPTTTSTTYYVNMFVGTQEKTTIYENDGDYVNYYLSDGASGIGFYRVSGSVDLVANRAYLPLLTSMPDRTNTRFIGFEFGDESDGTTNLSPAISKGDGEGEWYTLQGQRVAKPGKGLYIKNGKKILIK